jgi:hypothetical protein
MNVTLSKVKVCEFASEETVCFKAELVIDGVKAAVVGNDGKGGSNYYHFDDRTVEKAFNAFCEAMPPVKSEVGDLPMDADLYVGELLDAWQNAAFLKRHCKNKTVFRMPCDKAGEYRTIKNPFTPAVKDFLLRKYGPKVEIMNEKVA